MLIINVICFIPYYIYDKGPDLPNAYVDLFGVFYFNSPHFKAWQIITHMFMHGGIWHIVFNMFALYSFGPILEYILGSKRFLNFYFICGLGALALQMFVQGLEVHSLIGHFTLDPSSNLRLTTEEFAKLKDIYENPMVGASGAIFGVLIAFAYLLPNAELMIMFIPVPVKAKYVVPVYMIYELGSGLGQFAGDSVAHFAHIGGALFGFLLIKLWRVQRPNNFM
ncbi:rhomboid family intramembrane serine protease [Mucilaginibacter polytrichastri]|uniref:rhomboid family intramembrane serine protease n=1 Tax=Mucilaginibacter polytrichastri TaxID=1302689 RepID=UPI002936DBC8|nr:rhomboid family intramembrane serine protease [Mucilaginibacter polytrichastri]